MFPFQALKRERGQLAFARQTAAESPTTVSSPQAGTRPFSRGSLVGPLLALLLFQALKQVRGHLAEATSNLYLLYTSFQALKRDRGLGAIGRFARVGAWMKKFQALKRDRDLVAYDGP